MVQSDGHVLIAHVFQLFKFITNTQKQISHISHIDQLISIIYLTAVAEFFCHTIPQNALRLWG